MAVKQQAGLIIPKVESPAPFLTGIGAFDPDLDIILAYNASDIGLGAVLSHRMPDRNEKPIAFTSHTCFSRVAFRTSWHFTNEITDAWSGVVARN